MGFVTKHVNRTRRIKKTVRNEQRYDRIFFAGIKQSGDRRQILNFDTIQFISTEDISVHVTSSKSKLRFLLNVSGLLVASIVLSIKLSRSAYH